MTLQEFQQLANAGYNRIPVTRKLLADLDTPLSVYLKLANAPYSYLFESVQGGEKWGRYSIIGLPCYTIIKISDQNITITKNNKITETITSNDPLKWLESFYSQFRVPKLDNMPPFSGGLVGYFGYDTIRYIEPRLAQHKPAETINTPDILLMISDDVLVFDNLRCELYLITHADPKQTNAWENAQQRLKQLETDLQNKSLNHKKNTASFELEEAQSNQTFEQFETAVNRAKQYIYDGEVMQVVYSRQLALPFKHPPIELYRVLRCLNPSPYMYYLNLEDFSIVGSSPEILVHLENDSVTLRPLAGTRPRGKTAEEDLQLEKDLLDDKKELAEHLMLIDLGRNDIGRIAETGSVQLTEKMVIERYSHVMHIVSNVTGKLKPDLSPFDVLRATFPAGTLSGAPKIRAMEIIDELEPTKRGIYGGAIGYIGWNGNLDTAIAIRTAVIKDDVLYTQAGAGLVADSVPENEWDETSNKSQAILRAAHKVVKGI